MKYKDYYEILGLPRSATTAEIKQAYRKLAHQFHPDVSKDAEGEAKFKDISEAYRTLKDSDKRAEYDQLGQHRSGESFTPPPDWGRQAGAGADFGDIDLEDFFASFSGARRRGRQSTAVPGQDFEVRTTITLEQIHAGAEIEIGVSLPEYDSAGSMRRVPRTFRVKVPKNAQDGQRLRLPGKGGPGLNGGPAGDLYVVMQLAEHPVFRVSERDLYLDLPLTPWEAVLGASVPVPTLGGTVELTVPPNTVAGRKFRLQKRGLPAKGKAEATGDLYAVVRIEVPAAASAGERELYTKLAAASRFTPRSAVQADKGGKS